MTTSGYSGTPLAKKLGLKTGQAVAFVRLPESLAALKEAALYRRIELAPDWRALPEGARDLIHLFTTEARDLAALPVLRDMITPEGTIWVSWPKASAKVATDLSEDAIRAAALGDVLVDTKVCAVDAIWSGLKLVIRKEHRASHINAGLPA
jgi:hypothetical protein